MAAIFKKDGKHFIRFIDNNGLERIMELKEGRKYLKNLFEERKREFLHRKKTLQNPFMESKNMSIFFTTHNSIKGEYLFL